MRKNVLDMNLVCGLSFHVTRHSTGWETVEGVRDKFKFWANGNKRLGCWSLSLILGKLKFDLVKITV